MVLGAGSGGLAAAKRAAGHGANVAIIEGDRVGGTCVIRGCVPKKLLVYGSIYRDLLASASSFGITLSASSDTKVLLENVRKEVDRLNRLHIDLLEKAGVTLIKGWGSFTGPNNVIVRNDVKENSIEIKANRFLISVGGRPCRPNIPGASLGWVSDDMFLKDDFPKKVVVVGGGYIGCEFACILSGLGVEVTQLVRGKYLLRGFDRELSSVLKEGMEMKDIRFDFGCSPTSLVIDSGELVLNTNNQQRYRSGGVLFATGRRPFLQGLNIEMAGVEVQQGRIVVDSKLATNVPHIYAVGDVTDRINLTPVAIDEGRAFADSVFGKQRRNVNYELVPHAVFASPEVASVGYTEEDAYEKFGKEAIRIFRARFRTMSQTLSKRGPRCLLKLIVKAQTDKVIGCHMVGENSAEIIQMASIAIGMGATKSDFDKTMALHPTVAEEFVTMT